MFMRSSLRRKIKCFLPFFFILAASVVLLAPGLAAWDKATIGQEFLDGPTTFYQFRDFLNRSLQSGQLPLWNPLINCGIPFHAEGEAAIFYPVNLLLSPFSAPVALTLYALMHLAGAGCFLFLFLRRLGVGRFAAGLGGVIFVLSSEPTARLFAGHYGNLPNLALFPALLWVWEGWRRDGRPSFLTLAALFYGCLILGGHPQYLFYSSIFLLFYIAATSLQAAQGGALRPAFSLAAMFAGALCVGILVGAVQLFPTLDFVKDSFRQETTYGFSSSFSFPPENLLTLLVPTFFGNMAEGPYWGRWYLWEMWVYVGVFPLALALGAAFSPKDDRVVVFRWAVPLFILLALGGYTPLFSFLFRFVPGFDLFRGNSKFILYALFSLCSLAAVGADRIMAPDPTPAAEMKKDLRRLVGFLVVFALAGILTVVFMGGSSGSQQGAWQTMIRRVADKGEWMFSPDRLPLAHVLWGTARDALWRTVILSAAGLAVVLPWRFVGNRRLLRIFLIGGLVVPELWLFSREYIVTTPVEAGALEPSHLEMLKTLEPARVVSSVNSPNALMPAQIETVVGYTSNMLGRYNDFLTSISGASLTQPMLSGNVPISPQLLWPNAGYLVMGEGEQLPPGTAEELNRANGTVLHRVRGKFPRAYFSSNFRIAEDRKTSASQVASGAHNILDADLAEAKDARLFDGVGVPAPEDSVEILRRSLNSVIIKTTAEGPRLLVLSDAYDKHWVCVLDDKGELPIYPVNIAFRSVIVPPGEHVLTFKYRPKAFYVGSAVTLLAVLVSLLPTVLIKKRASSV